MNKNPFPAKSKIKDWSAVQFITVCTLTVDESILQDDVMEYLVPALVEAGVVVLGDKCHATRVGNHLIICKASSYIDLGTEDKGN